jgi:hypothetical protein
MSNSGGHTASQACEALVYLKAIKAMQADVCGGDVADYSRRQVSNAIVIAQMKAKDRAVDLIRRNEIFFGPED